MSRSGPALMISIVFVAFVVAGIVSVSLQNVKHEKIQSGQSTKVVSTGLNQEQLLGANLYLASSAEYQAVCLQIYSWAKAKLASKHEHYLKGDKKYPAVIIMDLDETVLDNSAYQKMLYEKKAEHTDALWEEYESKHADKVRAVAGAKDFIAYAEARGITVYYISNRKVSAAQATKRSLDSLGINTENFEKRYLGREGESTNKSSRRDKVREIAEVLLYVGDNLRDFDENFAFPKFSENTTFSERLVAVDARNEKVRQARKMFGEEWIILPNPVYGEWTKPAKDTDPKKLLP